MVEGQNDMATITELAKMYQWWRPKNIKDENKNVTRDGEVPA
jgi:hypothetical protein